MANFDYKQRPSTPDYRDNWERLYGKKSADASALSNSPESPKDLKVEGSGPLSSFPSPFTSTITVTVKMHKAHLLAGKALIAFSVWCAGLGAACIVSSTYVEKRTSKATRSVFYGLLIEGLLIALIYVIFALLPKVVR